LTPKGLAFAMQALIALYEGDGNRAWTLMDGVWRELTKSHFLRVEFEAIGALEVRASAAIAAAAAHHGAKSFVREATRAASALARKHASWAVALSMLKRACIANLRGERTATVELLNRAESEFRVCEMAHYTAVCQYRRGKLIAGSEGDGLVAAAEAWAKSQRVVNPSRMFDMLAPGPWGEAGER